MNELSLRQLRVFRAVARHASITRAAQELLVSQPSVTAQIRAIEARLGVSLLDRRATGVVLTDAGRIIDDYAARLLALADELEMSAADIRGLKAGRLRIGGSSTASEYLLPRLLGRFRASYPGITIQIEIHNTATVLERVREHRLDLGFVGDAVDDARLDVEPFCDDELVLVTAPQHPLASLPQPVPPDTLADLNWVVREPGSATRRAGERCLRRMGVPVSAALELSSTTAIKQVVIAGGAASFVSRYAIEAELAAGLLTMIPVAGLHCTRRFFTIWPRDIRLTEAERAFRHLARRAFDAAASK